MRPTHAGYYHVTSRSIAEERIFRDHRDYLQASRSSPSSHLGLLRLSRLLPHADALPPAGSFETDQLAAAIRRSTDAMRAASTGAIATRPRLRLSVHLRGRRSDVHPTGLPDYVAATPGDVPGRGARSTHVLLRSSAEATARASSRARRPTRRRGEAVALVEGDRRRVLLHRQRTAVCPAPFAFSSSASSSSCPTPWRRRDGTTEIDSSGVCSSDEAVAGLVRGKSLNHAAPTRLPVSWAITARSPVRPQLST